MTDKPQPIEVFFAYAREDEALRDELEKYLSTLRRQGAISGWHDRKIGAGKEWELEIDEHLNSAAVILLLVSADFIASDYCWGVEMKRALERHAAGEARVIPVILRACAWHKAQFGKLQALPTDGKAVTSWANHDEAFTDVALGIERAMEEVIEAWGSKTRSMVSGTMNTETSNRRSQESSTGKLPQPGNSEARHRKPDVLDRLMASFDNYLGESYVEQKRYDEAEAFYLRAIALDPQHARALTNLGTLLLDQKRYDKAELMFRRAVAADPQHARAYYNLGLLLHDQRQYDEAEAAYRRALALSPRYTGAHYNLGRLEHDQKRYGEAETAYRQAVALEPGHARAHTRLGRLLYDQKRYAEAEVEYLRAIELDARNADVRYNLAMVLRQMGRAGDAIPALESLRRIRGNGDDLISLMGAYIQAGMEKARALEGNVRERLDQGDWYNRACLEAIVGHHEASLEALKKARETKGFNADWARDDPNLAGLREDVRFWEIVGRGDDVGIKST